MDQSNHHQQESANNGRGGRRGPRRSHSINPGDLPLTAQESIAQIRTRPALASSDSLGEIVETISLKAMEATDGNNGNDAPNNQQIPPNPPSVEAAYKRKCIDLKKRLNEIEAYNDEMRLRNERGRRYINKMRLESCILLERLAAMNTGAGRSPLEPNPELRATAMGIMEQSATGALIGDEHGNNQATGSKRGLHPMGYLDDASDGSTDGHPPTPQERPLRPKRSRKPEDDAGANHGPSDNNAEPVSSTLPIILPAIGPHSPAAGYDPSGSAPMNPYSPVGSTRNAAIASRGGGSTNAAGGLASSPLRHHPSVANTSPFTPIASASGGHGQPHPHIPPASHRYVSAFEDFTNRNKDKVISLLLDRYGPDTRISENDVNDALVQEWSAMGPEEKQHYGDRIPGRNNGL